MDDRHIPPNEILFVDERLGPLRMPLVGPVVMDWTCLFCGGVNARHRPGCPVGRT